MKSRSPSDREIELLLGGLAQSLRAGVSVSNHLNAPNAMIGLSPTAQRIVSEELARGHTLSESFDRAHILSANALALIRSGEDAGALPEALEQVADWIKTARKERRTLWAGLAYPIVLLICASVILPLPVLVSQGLVAYLARAAVGLGGLAAAALLYFAYRRRSQDGPLQRLVESMKANIPGIRSVVRDGEIARFTDVLGRCLGAGLTMDTALAAAQDAAGWSGTHSVQLQCARNEINRGLGLSDALGGLNVFSAATLARIAQAEKIGNLEECLLQESTMARDRRRATVIKLSAVLTAVTFALVTVAIAFQIISSYGKYVGAIGEINQHQESH